MVVLVLGLIMTELIFRAMLFSNNNRFSQFREPGDYADFYSEDLFWKLYYRWDGKYKPPECVQPELGWTGNFARYSLMHFDLESYEGKRPVLLYGDSYAACSRPAAICFEEILNNNSVFASENHLYNYGVGGYGLDQIYLLFDKTYRNFENPFVVFSLYIYDLDRSILSVRTGQKPYFKIKGDSLKLHEVPLDANPGDYFKKNPPRVFSYLWRKFLFSKQNFLGTELTKQILGYNKVIEEKKQINQLILQQVVGKLKKDNIDFVFLVFHQLEYGRDNFGPEAENDWRNILLKDFFKRNKVPFIWSKDVILEDSIYRSYDIHQYFLPGDGHPTTHLNKLIAGQIKSFVMNSPSFSDKRIITDNERVKRIKKDTLVSFNITDQSLNFYDLGFTWYKDYLFYLEKEIRRDPGYMEMLREKAGEKNLNIDQVVRKFAMWLVYDNEKDCRN